MAMTHDYLDQLDQNVGIAPANSQEEYQAAQTIADIMRRHGVEPSIEEFDAKAFGGVMDQIMFAMLFVGMLLVGHWRRAVDRHRLCAGGAPRGGLCGSLPGQ